MNSVYCEKIWITQYNVRPRGANVDRFRPVYVRVPHYLAEFAAGGRWSVDIF